MLLAVLTEPLAHGHEQTDTSIEALLADLLREVAQTVVLQQVMLSVRHERNEICRLESDLGPEVGAGYRDGLATESV